jgi:hypothetical protein
LPAIQRRWILPAIGLGTLFIAGTFVCVTGSAGRGAEVAQRKAAAAGNFNEARKDIADQLAKARAHRAALAATMAKDSDRHKSGLKFPELPKSTAYDVAARAKAEPNSGLGLRVVS